MLSASDWGGIRAEYERHRHHAVETANGRVMHNPGQQWRTDFDATGFTVSPNGGGWTWGLELQSYGFSGHEITPAHAPRVATDGPRVTLERDAVVQEWCLNDGRGLEHGFTVRSRPAGGAGPLVFHIAVRGGLHPCVNEDGLGVQFQNEAGVAVLNYTGLTVLDADGKTVPAHFDPVQPGERVLRLAVEEQDARYPLTIDPVAQQAYLKASHTGAGDLFGYAVAVSGDTAVITAPLEDTLALNSGAAFVFVRTGAVWTQQAVLKAATAGANDQFGWSVAIDGNTIVVGTPWEDSNATGVNGNATDNSAADSGAAYVFFRNGSTWAQQAWLKASNTEAGDGFGGAVAVSGDTVIIGAPDEDSSSTINPSQADNTAPGIGAAYAFVRNGTAWTQQGFLKSLYSNAGDNLGWSVAVEGDSVVAGAPGDDMAAVDSGAVHYFRRFGTIWLANSYLKAGIPGGDDRLGYSIAISSNTLVVGARWEDTGGAHSGAAYVFVRPDAVTSWSEQAILKPFSPGTEDQFGHAVAIAGDLIAVGARNEAGSATGIGGNQADDSAPGAGAVFVFARSGSTWSQQAYLKASNTGAGDNFGWAVALSGNTILSGAWLEDSSATGMNGQGNDDGAANSGAAYVFTHTGQAWSQQAYLKAPSNSANLDQFGFSVSISGDTAVIGAPKEDSSGHDSGAAYVFVRSGCVWTQQAWLKASNAETFDEFGRSVAVSGDIIVVGAPEEDSVLPGVNPVGGQTNNGTSNAGAAYVFERNGGVWTQTAYLKASNPGTIDRFGWSAAADGETLVIGAINEASTATGVNGNQAGNNAPGAGGAYVFVRSGGVWSQQAYLKASNTEADDLFGQSVSVSGDFIIVGADREDSNATGVNGSGTNNDASTSGAAYAFQRSGIAWSQIGYLKASNTGASDGFGWSVGVSGGLFVVGALNEDSAATGVNGDGSDNNAAAAGAAYVFIYNGVWTQEAYLKASNTGSGDNFGASVAIAGNDAVVGARYESSNATGVNGDQSNNNASTAGAVYRFHRSRDTWSHYDYLKASNTGSGDNFGAAVAISGTTVLVGAPGEDSNARGVNGNQADNTAFDSGAAYTFDLEALTCYETWLQTWFGNPNGNGNESELADYDKDGLVNMLEFSLVQNPLVSSPRPTVLTKNGAVLEFTWPRLKCALEDITFTVEWSDTMAALTWSTTGVTETILSDDGITQQVKTSIPAGTSLKRFVRLRAVFK